MERKAKTEKEGSVKIKVKYIPSNFIARIGYNGSEFFALAWKEA